MTRAQTQEYLEDIRPTMLKLRQVEYLLALPIDYDNLKGVSYGEKVSKLTLGNTVFVDVTADWCITCKANKIGVILQDPVYSELQQENVITMKGDWTKPSDKITNYLKSHQRFGVPLNVVYGPNAPQGLPLSVLLNSDDVIRALEYAGRK